MTRVDSADQTYPVNVQAAYPDRSSRVLAVLGLLFFIKSALLLPHMIVIFVLGIIGIAAMLVAWVAILVTGRHPRSLFDFQVGLLRWNARMNAWLVGVVDKYPPLRLSE